MSLTAPDVDLVTPIREFFDRRITSDYRHALLSGGGWDPDLMAELDDLGWFELTRPENRGGLGIDLTAVAGLIALVGDRLVPGPLVEQLILPAYLDIPEGSLVAFADPAVTLDWASSIGSVHMESGQIQGTIELVRFGAEADSLVLAVDGPDGPALLLLPGSDPRWRSRRSPVLIPHRITCAWRSHRELSPTPRSSPPESKRPHSYDRSGHGSGFSPRAKSVVSPAVCSRKLSSTSRSASNSASPSDPSKP